ncbi:MULTISPECIES: HAD-IB family hydrolase [unclassified Methylomonas]|uniref:HAD-IB family hydrolase n=1 Tax=unclassified Methylomonas TaxID=2608980 RepID=UPI0008DA0F53|nr:MULTISPECIES: HAD-IB family hydrolase [unclassified Methylomonas]NJA04836.1 HAD-IB family hydrolase [Methylococcaceae bacterium WWC4]OHX35248.1 hypothetical protein BJL95_01515 [Methylomonas sp. LWB]WGS87806.1 HAD-IB family hydrolase [Methylomonas sp. UP202]
MAKVAFFDFDGTLTRRDSLLPFLRLVAGTPRFVGRMALLSPVLAAYAINLIRNDVAKERVLSYFLEGMEQKSLQRLGANFANERLPDMLRLAGVERLRWHQDQGHTCVLVSASLDVYLTPWASKIGFDDWITSSLEIDDAERIIGRLNGGNCFGEKKVHRIRDWLANKEFSYSYAYGDSSGDIPMLSLVNEGYLLNDGEFSLIHQVKRP